MSNIEHYFENLLFSGEDVMGGINKAQLSKAEQRAIAECAAYVLYTLFNGQEDFERYIKAHMEGEE